MQADRWRMAQCLESTRRAAGGRRSRTTSGTAPRSRSSAQSDDGRWVVGGELCENRAAAYQLAGMAVADRPESQIVVGASLSGDPALEELGRPDLEGGEG